MTNEIEQAFETWRLVCPWTRTDIPKKRAFKAGYKAGAEAKEQDHAAAIKAERARVLRDVEQYILRQDWCPLDRDWETN